MAEYGSLRIGMSIETSGDKPKGPGLVWPLSGLLLVVAGTYFFVFEGNTGTEYTHTFQITERATLTLSATPTEAASIAAMALGVLLLMKRS